MRQLNRRRRFSNSQHSRLLLPRFRVTCGDLTSFEARTSQFLLPNTQGTYLRSPHEEMFGVQIRYTKLTLSAVLGT